MGIGAGARCYWCGDLASELDHLLAVAEHGPHNAGPRVPSCRRCNAKRGVETQRRLAERRRGEAPAFLPRFAPPGSRPLRRRVYPGAIDLG
jgi:5-methylcytosine-specific restriction endonuclease McrA